jgi:hypothetical protein
MTKKDYVRIVEDLGVALNKSVDLGIPVDHARTTLRTAAAAFVYSEERENSRFDRERFFKALAVVGI